MKIQRFALGALGLWTIFLAGCAAQPPRLLTPDEYAQNKQRQQKAAQSTNR